MKERIKVAVVGAGGLMGSEVLKFVLDDTELELVAAVSRSKIGQDAGTLIGRAECGVVISENIEKTMMDTKPKVMVDFTNPQCAYAHAALAIKHRIHPIMGTTGFTNEQVKQLHIECEKKQIGGLIAPNFSVGALLMMKFAAQAAKYFPYVEVVEYHGDHKQDAPSATAIKTAEFMSKHRKPIRQGSDQEMETIDGSRGGYYNGFRIHSVRLPGIFAQQEVIFGDFGQVLKIRHDSYERASYMPGVKTAIQKVFTYTGMVYGFEHLID